MRDLSIIIPAYNAASTLSRCLDSVLASESWASGGTEVLVVNDGSTDHTAEVCASYVAEHAGIRLIETANAGVSAARNRGIDEASGEFMTFLDADDHVAPNYHSRMLDALAQDQLLDMVVAGITAISGSTQHVSDAGNTRMTAAEVAANIATIAQRGVLNSVNNKVFRTNRIPEVRFEVGRKSAEDLFFVLDALAVSRAVQFVPDAGMFYVRQEGSTTEAMYASYQPEHDLDKSRAYRHRLLEQFARLGVPTSEVDRYFAAKDQVWFHIMVTNILKPDSPYQGRGQLRQIRRVMDFEPPRRSILRSRDRGRLPMLNRAVYRLNSPRLARTAFRLL